MEKGSFKMFCFLLRVVLLIQLTYSINHLLGAEASQSEVLERLSKIEAHNQQQTEEMSLVKTQAIEDRNEIHELRNRVAQLEAASTMLPNISSDAIFERPKRPIRLLPASLFRNNEDDEDKIVDEFYGPPTSCEELRKLGYTLNGYYMVKGKINLNSSQIRAIYCQFKQPRWKKHQGSEIIIGNVEIKTRSVHFFVQRNTSFTYGTIPFEIEQLNVGSAMNLSTGIFTAPVAGIYHFQFSGRKDESTEYLVVELQLNGKRISYAEAGKYKGHNNIFSTNINEIHVSLRLKMGDRVNLYKYGYAALSDASGIPITHFTGSLLEENLELA